jgi:hypothetical protein
MKHDQNLSIDCDVFITYDVSIVYSLSGFILKVIIILTCCFAFVHFLVEDISMVYRFCYSNFGLE